MLDQTIRQTILTLRDAGNGIRAIARAHGATTAQVRLAWTLHQGPHLLAIPGTSNPHHLVQNVAAGALRLSPEELASLDYQVSGDQ